MYTYIYNICVCIDMYFHMVADIVFLESILGIKKKKHISQLFQSSNNDISMIKLGVNLRNWEATSRWIYPLSMASASLSLQVDLNFKQPDYFLLFGFIIYIYIYSIYLFFLIYIYIYTCILSGWLKLCDFLAGYVD